MSAYISREYFFDRKVLTIKWPFSNRCTTDLFALMKTVIENHNFVAGSVTFIFSRPIKNRSIDLPNKLISRNIEHHNWLGNTTDQDCTNFHSTYTF